ncbi:multiple epidermal growth factor-like domains 10, partial [Plakobranchus ocellatus]
RNVALNEAAKQSPYYLDWDASKAVDGNPGIEGTPTKDSSRTTCSHTADYEGGVWSVTLSKAVEINRLVIYNRRDCCADRLVNFTLQAFPSSGTNPIYSYTDPGGPAQPVYIVVPSPPVGFSVKSLQFDVSKNTDKKNIMTLCEVYVFGDVVCPPGKFGRQCEHDCNCVNQTEACFVSTGGCPSGCAAGYMGENCSTKCSLGTYGKDCDRNCSVHCAGDENLCNYVSGTCDQGCNAGYLMPLCEKKCPISKYGQDCTETCNSACLNSECHHVMGQCNDCPKGYTGVFCDQECAHATYGSGCNQNCSVNCLDQTCDRKDGKCIECKDTRTGDFCDIEVGGNEAGGEGSGEGGVPVVVVVAVALIAAIAIITAIIVGILYWRRRNVSNTINGIKRNNSQGDNGNITYVTDFDHYDRPSDLEGSNGPYERSLSTTGSARHLENTNNDNRGAAIGHANHTGIRMHMTNQTSNIRMLQSNHNEQLSNTLESNGPGGNSGNPNETVSDGYVRPDELVSNGRPYVSSLPMRRDSVSLDLSNGQNTPAAMGQDQRQVQAYQNVKMD